MARPAFPQVHPNDVDLSTTLCRGIEMKMPIISAAMDTVTEAGLAIALAQEGGMGVIHKNLSIDEQAAEVDKVKRSEAGMIVDPVTMRPGQLIREALEVMAHYKISGVPVTDDQGQLVGILTNRDLRFEDDDSKRIDELMTKENLVTVAEGTTLEEAKRLLQYTRMTAAEISQRTGFSEPAYFNRAFKSIVGCTPVEFRTIENLRASMLEG